jgi:hypothetical protein
MPDLLSIGIDVNAEELLSLTEAAQHPAFRHPRGEPCSLAKIYRMINPGVRGHRLECVRCPGLKTSSEAIARFVAKLTFGDSASAPTTASERRRRERVDRELERLGIS